MKLEEFNKLTFSCRCIAKCRWGADIEIQAHQARQWALDSIRSSTQIFVLLTGKVLVIGVDPADGLFAEEVKP